VATLGGQTNVKEGLAAVSIGERNIVRRICSEMERLGFELFALERESGRSQRWLAQWRPSDARSDTPYGASAASASEAAQAALVDAESSLDGCYPIRPVQRSIW